MKHIWLRILAAATCAAMLMTGMPAIATEEVTESAEIAEIAASSEAVTDNATPEPEAPAGNDPEPLAPNAPAVKPTASPAIDMLVAMGIEPEALIEALGISMEQLCAMSTAEVKKAVETYLAIPTVKPSDSHHAAIDLLLAMGIEPEALIEALGISMEQLCAMSAAEVEEAVEAYLAIPTVRPSDAAPIAIDILLAMGIEPEALIEALGINMEQLCAMSAAEVEEAVEAYLNSSAPTGEFVIESGVLAAYKGAGGDVTVPDGVTAIGKDAFKGCTALTSLTLPRGVAEIGESAFEGCSSLARVFLCDELRTIGPRAFKDCEALKAIDLPKNLEIIGEFAFEGCKKLEGIVLPEKLRQLGGVIERGDQHIFKDCVALKKAVLPEGMTVLGASMFAGCTALEELKLPSTLTSIESGALSGCTALQTLTLPSGVTQIAGDAFANCPKLTVVLSYGSAAEAACKAAKIAYTYKDAPTGVTLTAERTTIGLNEKLALTAQVKPAGVNGALTFASSNTRYVTVDANGVITGKRAGSATITVSTYNGKKATLKIPVKKAPSSVSLKTTRTILGVGEAAQLTATLSSGSAGGYSFSSADETKLTVDETGLVTALQPGEVSVTVRTYNGKTKSGVITVMSAPESITLADTSLKIGAEDSARLTYTLNEGSAGAVSFASSDETIATVDADGTIHALTAGSATVTATSYNGVSADCALSVSPAPSAVTLTAERTTIGLNEKLQLSTQLEPADTVGTLTFSSSNTRYVTVDANGVITGKRAGSATITVKTYNGQKATLKITVKKSPTSVSLKTNRTVLGVGETAQLTATLSSGSAGGYSFFSADETKLTVNENGLVTALQPGEVSVSVKTYNGKTKSGTITVMSAPEQIILAETALKIGAEDSAKLSYTLNEGSAGAISFTSSDETIATVDADGTIRALKAGSATVTAATYNGKLAFCEVAVLPAPSYVVLPYATLNLGLGDTIQLEPEVDPGCISSFRYSSSNTRYATVSEAGLVTAKKVGSVTITVKTYNGKSFKLKLNVKKAPSSLKLSPSSMTLGVGESMQLGYSITSGTATTLRYASGDERIAAVNESGMITGLAAGETRITATTHNGKTASCTVTVVPAPESIALTAAGLMGVGQTMQLNPTLLPEGCHTTLRYELVSGDAVTVDESGAVKAVQPGSATLRVSTHVEGVYIDHTILVKPSPASISFDAESYTVNIDETLQLSPILKPDDCYAELHYAIARAGFFTIDESGLITPIMRGSTTVTVTTHNGLSATVEIRVVDPYFPEEIAFKSAPPGYLELGMTYQPQIEVYPETAVAALSWTSSDPKIVSVDGETGLATAMSYGTATITATSARNPALTLVYKLVVLSPERCLKMPNRRVTSTASISTTLSQIKNVRTSAYDELESLYVRGVISASDYSKRRAIVERAFEMYLFPWMTNNLELYWKAANSENGLKDYKPGTVYFGMPYTQTERTYNVDKALSSGKFVDTKKGYYLMDGSKFADRMYPGSDCSSFVSMAIWGMGTSHSADSTRGIGSTTVYRTLTDTKDLRPGDILNKSGSHVVMFLYYADAERTQMVIIEQGGGEIDTNTISCSIRDIASYIDKGYKIRRLATLG